MENKNSIYYCLLALALMIATAALSLGIVVITSPKLHSDESSTNGNTHQPERSAAIKSSDGEDKFSYKDKIYVFGYDVPWEKYQYVGDDGRLQGLTVDVINAVCREAGKSCRHVVTPIKYCWNATDQMGIGLLSRWFDACAVFLKTEARDNVFRFSGRFYTSKKGQMYIRSTSQIDFSKLYQLTIGIKSNWYIGKRCLNKIDKRIENVIEVETEDQLYKVLTNETVDAILVEEGYFDGHSEIKSTSRTFECALDGAGVMHRVDSDIPYWFNPAFEVVKRQGAFKQLCDNYESVKATCIDY